MSKKYFNILVLVASLIALSILVYIGHYSIITFTVGIIFLVSLLIQLLRKAPSNFKLALISLFIMLFVGEIFFRITSSKDLSSHSENNSPKWIKSYVSIYHREDESHLYEGIKNLSYCVQRKEFKLCRDNNEYGIPHSRSIEPWKTSILFLGDSFTEGQGVSEDSSYVTEMWRKLNKDFNCINGGLAGSDLFYEWKLYTDNLKVLKPKALIFLINSTDVNDVMIRGGEERFDSSSAHQKGPFWEPFYASSFMVRKLVMSMGYNWLLTSPEQTEKNHLAAVEKLRAKVNNIAIESERLGLTAFFVLHPSDQECKLNRYDFKEFADIINDIPLKYKVNTLPAFNGGQLCDKIYWTYDRHFNALGYNILAEIVYNNLKDQIAIAMSKPD